MPEQTEQPKTDSSSKESTTAPPPAASVSPTAPVPKWIGKMCPILSVGSMVGKEIAKVVKTESRILTPGLSTPASKPAEESAGDVLACQGPSCMFFIPVADEKGRLIGGDCCIALSTQAQNQSSIAQHATAGAFEQLFKKFKIFPR